MSDPKVLIDYEFHFASGELMYLTVEDGRDEMDGDDQSLRFTIRDEPDVEDRVQVFISKLNGVRATKRILQPEPQSTLEDTIAKAVGEKSDG